MAVSNPRDFRFTAAQESARLLKASHLSSAIDSSSSLCVPLEGDRTSVLYRLALTPWLFMVPGLLLVLFAIVYLVLIPTPWVDAGPRTVASAGGAFVLGVIFFVLSNRVDDGLLASAVERRHGAATIRALEKRVAECFEFAIEDPTTYRKQKVISEDYAWGGLDATANRLLLAGVQYLYVLRQQDVTQVREDKDHVLITVRIGEAALTLAVSPLIGDFERDKHFRQECVARLAPPATAAIAS